MLRKRSFGTHDGPFHADEVTACALLVIFDVIDRDKVIRSRDQAKLAHCEYVCDVGGVYDSSLKRFDHHQVEYGGRLSSAGMILIYLREIGLIDDQMYDFINNSLVVGVDSIDNGLVTQPLGHCSFSGVISNFVPASYDAGDEALFQAFSRALDFVIDHLDRLRFRYQYIQSCKSQVKLSMQEGKEFLSFTEAMPWMDNFFELGGERHPARFVVMPAGRNWKLRGIPPSERQKMQVRQPLPDKWAGLLEEDLKRVSGIPGAIFCHKGRFISIWKTREDAIQALEKVLR
jgi:uncharacterized UPF0160 family protein